jgi:hypothetical protein
MLLNNVKQLREVISAQSTQYGKDEKNARKARAPIEVLAVPVLSVLQKGRYTPDTQDRKSLVAPVPFVV